MQFAGFRRPPRANYVVITLILVDISDFTFKMTLSLSTFDLVESLILKGAVLFVFKFFFS